MEQAGIPIILCVTMAETGERHMAANTFWKGYLKLSLVTCSVSLTPATTEGEKVRFHTLNRKTGNRVMSQYVDSVTGKPLDDDDEVKGYEHGEDQYVMLEEDEIDAVGLYSTRTIDIDSFVPRASIDWIWLDKPHYLTPNAEVSEEAFGVIRDAMQATDTVGISRLVMYNRERAVMIEPRDSGIVLWTLRYGDEVRPEDSYFSGVKTSKVDGEQMKLAVSLIEKQTETWDPSMTTDPVQAKLLDIISAKKKGLKKPAAKKETAEEKPSNVINIMDALRKSVSSEKGKKG